MRGERGSKLEGGRLAQVCSQYLGSSVNTGAQHYSQWILTELTETIGSYHAIAYNSVAFTDGVRPHLS